MWRPALHWELLLPSFAFIADGRSEKVQEVRNPFYIRVLQPQDWSNTVGDMVSSSLPQSPLDPLPGLQNILSSSWLQKCQGSLQVIILAVLDKAGGILHKLGQELFRMSTFLWRWQRSLKKACKWAGDMVPRCHVMVMIWAQN